MFEEAETGYLHLLIAGYNNSVVPCDDISIDQFLLLFFLHDSDAEIVAQLFGNGRCK